jgi:type I site-specific restriction-modification system R (restriction) subunit
MPNLTWIPEIYIVLVDEAHRTQEGDLRQMRAALPNAFYSGWQEHQ